MRIVRFSAFCTLIALASCTSTKKATTVTPPIQQPQVQQQFQASPASIDTAQPRFTPFQKENQKNISTDQSAMLAVDNSNNLQENKADVAIQPKTQNATTTDFDNMAASYENKKDENIQSFEQVKQMAATKQINLTSKQLKRLDKLDHKYHGDFNKFKQDTGNIFDTQTSKIIAAVGVVGLLLLIISGSGFGAFLLILSVGALLLKWLGIISF